MGLPWDHPNTDLSAMATRAGGRQHRTVGCGVAAKTHQPMRPAGRAVVARCTAGQPFRLRRCHFCKRCGPTGTIDDAAVGYA
jgi:hypothetical protein